MTLDLKMYLAALHDTLRTDVLPQVGDEHARSQLLGVIDVIDKLKGLSDWSPQMIAEQADALSRGLAELETLGGDAPGPQPPDAPPDINAAFRAEVESLYETSGLPDAGNRQAREAAVTRSLRAYLAAERKRIAAANYSAMT